MKEPIASLALWLASPGPFMKELRERTKVLADTSGAGGNYFPKGGLTEKLASPLPYQLRIWVMVVRHQMGLHGLMGS